MAIYSIRGWTPSIHPSAFVAEGAQIVGDVTIGEDVGVWFNSVIRADDASISIGSRTNLQDRSMVHSDPTQPVRIGERVSLGHGATVHAAVVEDLVLVGINAVVLNRAVVGSGSIIAAGAVVLEDQVIPPRSVVLGVPGKVVRQVTDEQVRWLEAMAEGYVQRLQEYRSSLGRLTL